MVADVAGLAPLHRGKMEIFWSGGALKYLFLLTDMSIISKFPLNELVCIRKSCAASARLSS